MRKITNKCVRVSSAEELFSLKFLKLILFVSEIPFYLYWKSSRLEFTNRFELLVFYWLFFLDYANSYFSIDQKPEKLMRQTFNT